jgi:hypothetical protein
MDNGPVKPVWMLALAFQGPEAAGRPPQKRDVDQVSRAALRHPSPVRSRCDSPPARRW